MDQATKSLIRKKIMEKQRNAYDLIKYLKTKTDRIVSYVISTEIKMEKNNFYPVVTIKEFPEIRIFHDLPGSDEEYLKNIDIENMEG